MLFNTFFPPFCLFNIEISTNYAKNYKILISCGKKRDNPCFGGDAAPQ